VEAYTALVLTETSFTSEFYPGTVHDMQVRYYNCGKNRGEEKRKKERKEKKEREKKEKKRKKEKKQNSSGCTVTLET
jgi:prophage tail gpP-like protein